MHSLLSTMLIFVPFYVGLRAAGIYGPPKISIIKPLELTEMDIMYFSMLMYFLNVKYLTAVFYLQLYFGHLKGSDEVFY